MEQLSDNTSDPEVNLGKIYTDALDRVSRRDVLGEIHSGVPSETYKRGYDQIKWDIK